MAPVQSERGISVLLRLSCLSGHASPTQAQSGGADLVELAAIETGDQAELVRTLADPVGAAGAVTGIEVGGTNEHASGVAIERGGEHISVSEPSSPRHRRTADFAVGAGLTPLRTSVATRR